MDEETYIIREIKPLSECSKTHAMDGELASDDHPSEWAINYAFAKIGLNTPFNDKQLKAALEDAILQQNLDSLVEEGYIEACWEDNEIKYRITEKGRRKRNDERGRSL